MIRLLPILGLALLASCGGKPADSEATADTAEVAAAEPQQPVFGDWGVDLSTMDTSVKPGDDFFRYMNGKWLDANEIPADRSSHGISLALHEQAQEQVREIIEELGAKNSPMGSPEQKVGDYYKSWMDTETLNKKGIAPLQADLDRIAAIENTQQLAAEFGRMHYVFGASPIGQSLSIDPRDPDKHLLVVYLSGLGLPDKSYYQDDAERFAEVRRQYVPYIASMLEFAGVDNSAEKAANIMALETAIAEYQWDRADRRDRDKTNNPTLLSELKQRHPEFAWDTYLDAGRVEGISEVNLSHPDTVAPLVKLINEQPLQTWKDYLTYHMVSNSAGVLSEEIDAANFEFWGKVISGREAQLDRWKRGVSRVGARTGLGEAIGQIYVDRHFPASSKSQMLELVENVRTAYGERIRELDWMSEATRKEALRKLAAFNAKIGYPDRWLDLSSIKIAKDDLFGNTRRIREFFEDRDMQRLNQPTDRDEWLMTPQTVNAYYLANFNEIVFPAAYLQPPNFDPAADPAVNYGSIGATIGHEMGHGFDDQGSKSDADGVKRNWWTDEDRAKFEAKVKVLADQYSSYSPIEGHFLNGRNTLGENIGDLGGLEVAYRAYKLSLNGEEAPVIDGYTGDQRFFLAYAQSWRGEWRDELTLRLLKSGAHPPNRFRANGVVRNMEAWYQAFDVKPGDKLYLAPEQRASIW
ncbi:MAG: M13 family metallopeptidase [Pseudomonadales bacterium]